MIDRLTVCLARATQHNAEHMGPTSLAIDSDNRCADAEIDLSILAGRRFESSKRQGAALLKPVDIASDAVIAAVKAILGDQVLMDPLGRKLLLELGHNSLMERPALTGRGPIGDRLVRLGPGGRLGTV